MSGTIIQQNTIVRQWKQIRKFHIFYLTFLLLKDSPPPFGETFQLHSEQGFINVSWQPYSGSKRLLRYVITYRTVPEVAYHVKPIHVNTTHYVINTRSHLGQLFALRLSYLTEGGEGTPSGVKIIRAGEKIYSRRTLKHVKTYTFILL